MRTFSLLHYKIYRTLLEDYVTKVIQEEPYWVSQNPSFLIEVINFNFPKGNGVHSILSYYIDHFPFSADD